MKTKDKLPATQTIDPADKAAIDTAISAIKIKDLTKKGILLNLSIGAFTGLKKDKQASQELITENHADQASARVTKNLLKSKQTKEIQSIAQQLRATLYQKTLPWGDNGDRIVPTRSYMQVKLELEQLIVKYYEAVQGAAKEYENMIDGDRKNLGSLFNQSDYPSKAIYAGAFYARIEVEPVPDTDFRSNVLSEKEVVDINNQVEERITDALKHAERDILSRVLNKVAHSVTKLLDTEGNLHNSVISNVIQAIDDARALNVNDSEEIETVLASIKTSFGTLDAESIRRSDVARNEAVSAAHKAQKEIIAAMSAFA